MTENSYRKGRIKKETTAKSLTKVDDSNIPSVILHKKIR